MHACELQSNSSQYTLLMSTMNSDELLVKQVALYLAEMANMLVDVTALIRREILWATKHLFESYGRKMLTSLQMVGEN